MPHVHTIVQALFEHPTAGVGDILIVQLLHAALFTAKEAAVGFALGASFGFALGVLHVAVADPAARAPPLRRRVADGADPRRRADRRRLPRKPPRRGLVLRRRDRRVPDVLPGGDQHAARPALDRPARRRADALVSPRAAGRSSGSCACRPRCRTSSPRSRSSATACVVGAIIGEAPSSIQEGLGGYIVNFNQYYTLNPQNLWATNVIAAALGISFFLVDRPRGEARRHAERRSTSA